MEEIVGHGSAEHSIAEVFHSLVVDVVIAHGLGGHRFVREGYAIQSDISRIEAEDIMNILVERLVLRVFGSEEGGESHLRIQTF